MAETTPIARSPAPRTKEKNALPQKLVQCVLKQALPHANAAELLVLVSQGLANLVPLMLGNLLATLLFY